jgi:hypothetical protein
MSAKLTLLLCFCMTTFLAFGQKSIKKAKIKDPLSINKVRKFSPYIAYNATTINNGALDRLIDLHNESHLPKDTYTRYRSINKINGFGAGLMAWQGKLYADIGFNVRKNEVTARFKDVQNQFQTLALSMNSFHLGFGANMSDPQHKVIVSPGVSFGMGKVIVKEIVYRAGDDLMIPVEQKKPVGIADDSKNIGSLNLFGTAYVNFMIGNLKKGPKIMFQPFVTIPMVQNDLTKAFYPSDFESTDVALKARLTYYGFKVAIGI